MEQLALRNILSGLSGYRRKN